MLVNVYLISTLISLLIIIKKDIEFNNRLYKKGYEYKDKKIIKKILDFLEEMFYILLPIFNIVIAVFTLLFMDSLFDEMFNDLRNEGKIKKIKKRKNIKK